MSDMGNLWREKFRKRFKVVLGGKAKKGPETKGYNPPPNEVVPEHTPPPPVSEKKVKIAIEQDEHPPDWARVVLMVSPDGKFVHAIGGDREAGTFVGLERLNNYVMSVFSTPDSDKLNAILETLSRVEAKSTQNFNKVRLWFGFYCRAINQLDDYFEYTAEKQTPEEIKKKVYGILGELTEKLKKSSLESPDLSSK